MPKRRTTGSRNGAARDGLGPREIADLGDASQLTGVASRYYLEGRTQSEIAEELALDASTVSRMLKRAREEGIVHIEIRPPRRRLIDLGLGRELSSRFGLQRAVVVARDSPSPLAEVAAEFVGGLLRDRMRVGVAGLSTTLSAVIHELPPGAVSALVIGQLNGGISDPLPGGHGRELVSFLAGLYPNCSVHYLHAPLVLDSPDVRAALMTDSSVRGALAAASQSELALVGIGQMDADATLFRTSGVSQEDRAVLLRAGAVGDMIGRFFDADGRPVTYLDGRTVGLDWDELRRVPQVAAVAAGTSKLQAITGALRTRCVHVLITDEETARALLQL